MLPILSEKELNIIEKALAMVQRYFIYLIVVGLCVVVVIQNMENKKLNVDIDAIQAKRIQDLNEDKKFYRDGFFKSQDDVIQDYRHRNDYRPQSPTLQSP